MWFCVSTMEVNGLQYCLVNIFFLQMRFISLETRSYSEVATEIPCMR